LNDVASEMIFPLLPTFLIGVLGGTKVHLGLIDGIGETASSLLKLWAGAHSDAIGRRKAFVLFGYGVSAVARPLIGLALAPWHVLALRTLDRVGKGVRTSPRDVLIAESTEEGNRGRAFGFNRAMDHLGAAIGPLIAFGFLWLWPGQLRLLIALALVPAIPILILLFFGLREAPRPKQRAAEKRFVPSLAPLDARFRLYLAALLIFTLGNSSDSFLLVRAAELGVPTTWLPVLWSLFHVVKSGGSQLAGSWIDRLRPRRVIWAGWLIYAATYMAFAFATAAWHAWALFFVYAIYYALAEPAEKTLVADLVGPQHRGLAYGWFNLTIGISALPASLLFGVVYEQYGALAAFGMGAALALIASTVLVGVDEPRTRKD
jgi:MFS family permease